MSAGALSGCLGDDDGDGDDDDSDGDTDGDADELGEQVPPVIIQYWSNAASPDMVERYLPTVQDNLEERLGLDVEIEPVEWATQTSQLYNDDQTFHMNVFAYTTAPARLDPFRLPRFYAIDNAGSGGEANTAQYASCEFSHYVMEGRQQLDEEQQREFVYDAQEVFSQDVPIVPMFDWFSLGAYRTDQIDIDGVGEAGVTNDNVHYLLKSSPRGDLDYIATDIADATVTTTNYPTIPFLPGFWTRLVHSPLLIWDENYNLNNHLAEGYEVSDDGLEITFTLKDATFHNGDPITAEAVRFTFDLLDRNSAEYPYANDVGWENIEAVDDETVVFSLAQPDSTVVTQTFSKWGIMHPDIWEPALENPTNFEFDPMVGSGPYEVENFSSGEQMRLTPYGEHFEFNPDHDIILQVYRDQQTVSQATAAGDIQASIGYSPSSFQSLKDDLGDDIESVLARGITPMSLHQQMSHGPTKYLEFREAVGAALDRQMINDLASDGLSNVELNSTIFAPAHPYRVPDDRLKTLAEDPSGDESAAQSILEDAGWSWDDSGTLHFPPDADLSPVWAADGGGPTPDEFPCVTSEGDWNPEYEPE